MYKYMQKYNNRGRVVSDIQYKLEQKARACISDVTQSLN